MKFYVIISVLSVAAVRANQDPALTSVAENVQQTGVADLATQQYPVRDLPADVLRDFPGACFGSTTFRFYQIGESWALSPFCGIASCLTDGLHLIERVRDCGLLPKPNPKCKIVNESDSKAAFPKCCPRFECEEGVELEYPTPEELRKLAEEAHRAQISATTANDPAQPASPVRRNAIRPRP